MSSSLASSEAVMSQPPPRPRTSPLVIDTDIHERGALADLLPYLDEKWHKHIQQYHWQPETRNPYAVPSAAGLNRADSNLPDGRPGGSDLGLLRQHVFDDAGVTHGILVGRLNASGLEPGWTEFKTGLMSAYNDWQIDKWLNPESRLSGSIHVNVHDPAGAAREIERLGRHPRMAQVMIYIGSRALGDPAFHPIYDAAAASGIPVGFHQSGNTPTTYGYHRYYIEWKTLVTQAFQSTLVSLIFNGVYDKFPTLKTIFVEGAFTWLPHIMSRADQHLRQLHAEVPWVQRLPSDIIRDQVKFSTQPMEEMTAAEFLRYLEQMKSDELLCYSSDYPHWDFDSPTEALPAGLPDDILNKVLFDNAKSFYGSRLPDSITES